jgi:hypothetical protein
MSRRIVIVLAIIPRTIPDFWTIGGKKRHASILVDLVANWGGWLCKEFRWNEIGATCRSKKKIRVFGVGLAGKLVWVSGATNEARMNEE